MFCLLCFGVPLKRFPLGLAVFKGDKARNVISPGYPLDLAASNGDRKDLKTRPSFCSCFLFVFCFFLGGGIPFWAVLNGPTNRTPLAPFWGVPYCRDDPLGAQMARHDVFQNEAVRRRECQ